MICKILEAMAKQYKPKNITFKDCYFVGVSSNYVFQYIDMNCKSHYITISEKHVRTLSLCDIVLGFAEQLDELCAKLGELQNV